MTIPGTALLTSTDHAPEPDEGVYRQCDSPVRHDHLTCRECGRSVEVEGRVVEQWAERVAAEAGFTSVNHTVELFGLCPDHSATSD